MYKNFSVLCIIPARRSSKGLPGKNIRLLGDKPLIAHTIGQAKASRSIDRVIVSTDSPQIAAAARAWGAEVPFRRPARLARDGSGTIDVLLHALDWVKRRERRTYDIVVLLHATTPLRAVADIEESVALLVKKRADSVFSVTDAHRNPYFNMVEADASGRLAPVKPGRFKTRQSAPRVYDMNSSIYVWWSRTLQNGKRTLQPKSAIHLMPKDRSVDIDDAMDFAFAEFLLKRKKKS